jgi:hypothetical protein
MTLSELADRFYCGHAQPAYVDPLLGFGTWLTGTPHPRTDPDLISAYAEDAALLKRYVPWLKPWTPKEVGGKYPNDLYEAQVGRDSDSIVRVRIPAFGPMLSTAAVEKDWRFLLVAFVSLASSTFFSRFDEPELGAALEKETVVLEVYWPGHVVMGYVRPAFWPTVLKAVLWAGQEHRPAQAGVACERCAIRGTCKAYEQLLDLPGEEDITGLRKSDAAKKLMLALMLARSAEKAATDRRRTLSRKLAALAVQGRIEVGNLFTIPVVDGTLEKYPYLAVRRALEAKGLWQEEFGAIALKPFKAALASLPKDVQTRLAELKIVETKEPVIKEMVDGVAASIQAPLLRGIAL